MALLRFLPGNSYEHLAGARVGIGHMTYAFRSDATIEELYFSTCQINGL
jgi:hypothetical protein